MRRLIPLLVAAAAFAAVPAPASAIAPPTGAGSVVYTYPYAWDGGVGTATCSYANGVLTGVGAASGEGEAWLTCTMYDRAGELVARTTGHAAQSPVVTGPEVLLDEYPFTICIEQFFAFTGGGQSVQFQGICEPIHGAHEG